MHPVLFEIFGRQIGTFGVFIIIGAAAAWFLIKILDKTKDKDIPLVFLICICGGLIGAFLLRPLMKIPEIISNWDYFRQLPIEIALIMIFGETVFYGGLIGGVTAMVIYCKIHKLPIIPIADLFAPALALAHGIGRIGCFFGGCCYGIPVNPSHPFAVIFPSHTAHPVYISGITPGTSILAIQLIEASCLFLLTAILVTIYKKSKTQGLTVCIYGIIYSILRFILELYRGDFIRGIYGEFSTSQYISMILLVGSLTFLILLKGRKKKNDY